MKKIIISITIAFAVCLNISVNAQNATAKLNEAETAYNAHDLDNARMALQGALNEINLAIGKKILEILPKTLNQMQFDTKADNVSNAGGFSGLFVERTYGTADKTAKVQIMGDSPLLTSLNALLSMPFAVGSQPNEKRLKISGYKSIMKKETGENNSVSYHFQIPVNQTLITFDVTGIAEESTVIAMANSLPIDEIAKTAK